MSFLAKFTLDDQTYNVLNCSYKIFKKIDYTGRPIEMPRIGLIKLVLESTNDDNLVAWTVFTDTYKNGEIVFLKRDASAASKKLIFTDGLCVEFEEIFNADGEYPMRTEISISVREFAVGGVSMSNRWSRPS
jgi:hypothetical protein